MPRFYLIDDEVWALADLEALLKQFSMVEAIRTFTDGRTALETILTDPPDVIFTDLRMDYMDGRTLINAVREKAIDVPIVIISAYSDFDVAREALSQGVFDYLLKPVSRESLQKMMVRLEAFLNAQISAATPEQIRAEVAAAYPVCWVLAFLEKNGSLKGKMEEAASGPCALRFDPMVHQGMRIAYLSNATDSLPETVSALDTAVGISCSRQGFTDLSTMIDEAILSAQCGFRFAQHELVRNVQSYLALHYEQQMSLDDLSSRFYISKAHLCDKFKKECGITVVAFLRDIRMAVAAQRLRDTGEAVGQIAASVGYLDNAYFTRTFRGIFGVSPEAYRRGS